ncbi:putative F-box associated interaction domain-containing protein [Helianthus annuus]|nr:putative F-box associated interaction domain-containing protein [Helianthus annuus]
MSRVEYGWSIITVLGFGVCRETNDPKIVKITPTTSFWQVEVFTLSTGAWRSPYSDDFSCKSVKFSCDQVVIDGCLYWLARDRLVDEYYNLIVSFDLTSEEFREVNLPDSLAGYGSFSMYKLSDSLAVIKESVDAHKLGFDVWRMEDDSFKKLYTISRHSPDVSILRVCGFRKTGEPLLEVILRAQHGYTGMLAAYESYSKPIANLWIIGRNFSVYNYMETLLLL